MVEQRGIEPLTSALRTRRSAKLSYCPTLKKRIQFRVSSFKKRIHRLHRLHRTEGGKRRPKAVGSRQRFPTTAGSAHANLRNIKTELLRRQVERFDYSGKWYLRR